MELQFSLKIKNKLKNDDKIVVSLVGSKSVIDKVGFATDRRRA